VGGMARAEEGKVVKTLPQYLDLKGRHTLSPSLFARDGYQAYLRLRPKDQGGIRLAVQWKWKGEDASHLHIKAEMRGLTGNTIQTKILDQPVHKNGWFSNWAELRLTGTNYAGFGALVAWRTSLWDGARELASQESFLWNGVPPPAQ